jgi:hypothetical protein
MKKALALLALFAVVTAGIFAEYNFSFYGKGVFTPIAVSGGDSSVSAATTTYANNGRPSVGFTLKANNSANTIGMNAVFDWDGDTPRIGANANIWTSPFSWITLRLGKFEVDDFRGKIGTVEFASWILPQGTRDEDTLFRRFKFNAGAHLTLKPLVWLDSPWAGITLEGAVGSNYGRKRAFENTVGWSAEDVYLSGQYAIGYRVPNAGLARVQFIGNNREIYIEDYLFKNNPLTKYRLAEGLTTNSDADIIEAAFLFDGIDNLKIEAGGKIPLPFETSIPNYYYYYSVYPNIPETTGGYNGVDTVAVQYPYQVSLGADFTWNDLNILGRADFSFGGTYEKKGINNIAIGAGLGALVSASYHLFDRYRAGLDVAYNYHKADTITINEKTEIIGERATDEETSEHSDIGFALWGSMTLGGGTIRAGVTLLIPSGARYDFDPGRISGNDRGWRKVFSGEPIISVPISVTYNF